MKGNNVCCKIFSRCHQDAFRKRCAVNDNDNLQKKWDANTRKTASPTATYIYDSAAGIYPEETIDASGHTVKKKKDDRIGKLLL